MIETIVKVAVTAVLVVAIAEAAKRSTLLGAFLASLPLTSLIAMIWLYAETHDSGRVAALSTGIFWMVLPSLVLFVALPVLIRSGVAFWPSLAVAATLTAASYLALAAILRRYGIDL